MAINVQKNNSLILDIIIREISVIRVRKISVLFVISV